MPRIIAALMAAAVLLASPASADGPTECKYTKAGITAKVAVTRPNAVVNDPSGDEEAAVLRRLSEMAAIDTSGYDVVIYADPALQVDMIVLFDREGCLRKIDSLTKAQTGQLLGEGV